MGIGKRIKEAREARHLTQKQLGNLVGVTGSAITNYENETSHPKEAVMYGLINSLEVDANFLFQDSVNQKKPTTDNGSGLDNGEQTLVDTYRDMTPKGQKVLLETAETLHGNFKKSDYATSEKGVG